MFWDLILTEIEQLALLDRVADKCPIVKRTNCSYNDVIKELLDSEDNNLGVEEDCKGCQFHINAPDYLNCALIAQEMSNRFKGFSSTETAEMFGISKSAMEKLEFRSFVKLMRSVFNDPKQEKLREHIKKKYNIK